MDTLHRVGPLLGRILIAHIFLISGYGKIPGFEGTAGYIASKGLPMPELIAAGTILLELGAGLLLVIGWQTRWAATALFIFTGLAALIFHNFWALPPEQVQMQMINFMKNLAMMGGMLYVIVYGAGPLSLDGRRRAAV